MDDRTQVSPRNDDGSRGRRPGGGLRIGPIRVTPTVVMLVVAVVGSFAFLAYTLTVRESSRRYLPGGLGRSCGAGDGPGDPRRDRVDHRPALLRGRDPLRAAQPALGSERTGPSARLGGARRAGGGSAAPSSRGLGRHPFKVEIRGSNPLGATTRAGQP